MLSVTHAMRRMYTYAVPCCFKAPVRKEGQRIVTRFQLQDDIEQQICSNDPWIILHKIDSPTKMRYIGSKVNSCNKTVDSMSVAPSIAHWVKRKGLLLSLVPLCEMKMPVHEAHRSAVPQNIDQALCSVSVLFILRVAITHMACMKSQVAKCIHQYHIQQLCSDGNCLVLQRSLMMMMQLQQKSSYRGGDSIWVGL